MYYFLVGLEYIVSITLLVMALTLFRNNIAKPVQYIQFSLLSMFLLNTGYLLEIQCTSVEGAVIATKMEYCGSVFTSTFMVFVVMEYLNMNMSIIIKRALVVIDVAILMLVLTNEYHDLFFKNVTFVESGFYPHVDFDNGIFRNLFAYYTMFLSIFMLVLITYYYIQGLRGGRKIQIAMPITIFLPISAVIIHLTGMVDTVDPSPMVIGLAGMCMYIFLRNDMIFELVNVAEHMVLDNMQDAFIVMDTHMRLLDMNNSARNLFPELVTDNDDSVLVYERSDILRQIINERTKDIVAIGDGYYYTDMLGIKNNNTLQGYCLHLSDRTDYKKYTDELIEHSIVEEEESA